MAEPHETYFAVAPEHEHAALAHLAERGFRPVRIDNRGDGLSTFVFAQIPEDRMYDLAMALPGQLSAKIGIVVGDNPPFSNR